MAAVLSFIPQPNLLLESFNSQLLKSNESNSYIKNDTASKIKEQGNRG